MTGEDEEGREGEPRTTEGRILELRKWVAKNYGKLLDEAKGSVLPEPGYGMTIIFERMKRQAMIQNPEHPIMPGTAKGLAESALAPYYDRIMSELKDWAEHGENKLKAAMREGRNLSKIGLGIFKTLEGQEKGPVERRLFKEELLKAKLTDTEAEKTIREMFREGYVYESKPGFIRRLGA